MDPDDAEPVSLPRVVLVTGTRRGIGKTIAIAALARALEVDRDLAVAAVQLVQTGVADWEAGSYDRLAKDYPGTIVRELVRLRPSGPPVAAARAAGAVLPRIGQHAGTIAEVADEVDVVFVEGSGAFLTPLDERGGTLASLGAALRYKGLSVGVAIVAGLTDDDVDTTLLTTSVVQGKGLAMLGVVVRGWNDPLDPAAHALAADLEEAADGTVLGRIPDLPTAWDAAYLRACAPSWMATR